MADRNPALIFDAVVTPHRSLAPKGFLTLMLAIAGLSFVAGFAFLLMGAWPIFGFFGLDVLLIYLAFRASYRSARSREEIRITTHEVVIRRVRADGSEQAVIRLNPYWVRVDAERDDEGRVMRLFIVSHGARHPIGDVLAPWERESFLRAFAAALGAAKR